jgi:phosphatidate cytidylyltransferase
MIGGTLAGLLASGALVAALPDGPRIGPVLLLAVAASIASQIGDLAESALKRHWEVKDSGWLIPGHGGFMDRLDGFWAVCVLAALVILVQGLGS